MLAYVFEGTNRFTLKEMPAPEPRPDNAILEVVACAICGSDVRTYRQGTGRFTPPRIIGHEVVGTLKHVGERIHGFAPGDRVAVAPAMGCGTCRTCQRGYPNVCEDLQSFGFECDGGFAQKMAIPQRAFGMTNVNKLPDHLSFEKATLAEPVACCINAQEFLNIKQGDVVAVFGAGYIGCTHIQLARRSGAQTLILIEPARHRAEAARTLLSGTHVLDPSGIDVVQACRELTDGAGVDVVITACPVGATHAQAVSMAAKRGRISLFGGIPGEPTGFLDSNAIHYKELSIYGVHASTPTQNRKALAWISEGSIPVDTFTHNIYPLSEIKSAFEAILQENITKVVIKP